MGAEQQKPEAPEVNLRLDMRPLLKGETTVAAMGALYSRVVEESSVEQGTPSQGELAAMAESDADTAALPHIYGPGGWAEQNLPT